MIGRAATATRAQPTSDIPSRHESQYCSATSTTTVTTGTGRHHFQHGHNPTIGGGDTVRGSRRTDPWTDITIIIIIIVHGCHHCRGRSCIIRTSRRRFITTSITTTSGAGRWRIVQDATHKARQTIIVCIIITIRIRRCCATTTTIGSRNGSRVVVIVVVVIILLNGSIQTATSTGHFLLSGCYGGYSWKSSTITLWSTAE